METHRLIVGLAVRLSAESFGEPGQRTFRVFVEAPRGSVSLWLEKEQVVMLGAAIEEILERVPPPGGSVPRWEGDATFAGDLEVRIGSLSLAYDEGSDAFRLEAEDFSAPLPVESIELLATRDQLSGMGEQIDDIVSASRPRCVLCGTPLGSEPHFCPESNGHAKLSG